MTSVLLSNVYSRTNHGDGLLFDLTLELLGDLGVRGGDVTVWAQDPASYRDDLLNVLGPPGQGGRWGRSVQVARTTARARLSPPPPADPGFDLLVACPGGYMNGRSGRQAAGFARRHLGQLVSGAALSRRRVVLPVTVGPMVGPFGGATRSLLSTWDRVYVRDGESEEFLAGLDNVRRVPDLVAMELARGIARSEPTDPANVRILMNARPVPRFGPGYVARLHHLRRLLPDARVGAQAGDDRAFLDGLGWPHRPFPDLLGDGPAVAVTVRLHAALMAIRAGVPAVHLAYDPKGVGAFQDLGLTDYLLDGRDFDPAGVAALVAGLRADPSPYWSALDRKRPQLLAARAGLLTDLGELIRR